MFTTIALAVWVMAGLAFIFIALNLEARREREHPEKRVLREAEEILLQASRQIRREAAQLHRARPTTNLLG